MLKAMCEMLSIGPLMAMQRLLSLKLPLLLLMVMPASEKRLD